MDHLSTSNGVFFDNHYQISVRLASCKLLKKAHLIILADTLSFNARGQVNFKSQDRIAAECGVHRHTVIAAIKQLREWGLLSAKESKFKETLKLVVNYPKMIQFIEKNETEYQKANFNPVDEETVADLKENGWLNHDVENFDSDEHHKNHDVENLDSRCREIRQPMSKTSTLIDHVIDHVSNKTTTTTREREFFDFNDYQGYANGADEVPTPPRWAVDIYYKAFGHSDLSGSMLQKQFGGFIVYNLSRNAGGVPTGQAQAMFSRWLSNDKAKTPNQARKSEGLPPAPGPRIERQQTAPPAQPEPSVLTPVEIAWLKQGNIPVGLHERLGEEKYTEVLKEYGLEDL